MKRSIQLFAVVIAIQNCIYGQSWPSFAGPTHNYVADPAETGITDNAAYITKVWESTERLGPGPSQAKRYGCTNLTKTPGGGSASPIVYDGKVYISFWEPVGPNYDHSIVNDLITVDSCDSATVMSRTDLWYIQGKDVVLCLDANTGAKLWRTTIDGLYRWDHSKNREANNTICEANGKIYGYTSIGKIFSLNANTGAINWQTAGWSSMVTALANSIVSNQFMSQAIIGSGVVFADSVVLFGTEGNTLYAYDAGNGNQLWTKGNAMGGQSMPVVWKYGGTTYIITANIDGDLWCLNPHTGATVWSLSGLGGNRSDVIVNGEYMMCYVEGEHQTHSQQKIGVYRINASGATHLWTHPETTPNNSCPGVIVNNRVYKIIESVQKLYCFDVETGMVMSSTGTGTEGHYFYYVDGKIITETDAEHSTSNNYTVYKADSNYVVKLTGWDWPFLETNGYE